MKTTKTTFTRSAKFIQKITNLSTGKVSYRVRKQTSTNYVNKTFSKLKDAKSFLATLSTK